MGEVYVGVHKKFSQELYEQNDHSGISAVLAHICDGTGYARVSDDLYGPDITVYGVGLRPLSYVEVEVKRGWLAGQFPYDTIHLPERKGKFLRKHLPIEFWILRADLTACIIIPDYVLNPQQLVEVPNILVPSGERFYQVPINDCVYKELIHD